MNTQTFNEILRKLENELSCLKIRTRNFIELTEKAMGLCNKVILEFREKVISEGFKNEKEEIYFFKYIKPKVNSKFIFHTEVFNIETHRPESDTTDQIRYLRDVLQKYCKYLKDNKEFYQYYKREKTFSDHIYFIRGNTDTRIHIDSIINHIDPEFSTGFDQTLARIIAYEQLKKYIGNEIEKLKTNPIHALNDKKQKEATSKLDWTGPHIAAVELIYALYYTKVINNGQVGFIEIANTFEKMFNIKLDDIYRSFKDIQERKTVRTRFLDNLRETLLRRLDDLEK